jgi:DNA repair exonuclease SbcCD ATPase subunit
VNCYEKINARMDKLSQEVTRRDEQNQQELRNLDDSKMALTVADDAAAVIQEAGEVAQRIAHERIAGTVTRCLAAVFDEPIEFRVVFEKKRGRTEARLVFVKGGNELQPLKGSGGVVEIAALALRCACLALSRPQARRLLLLDEPFRHVQAERRPRVAALLESLSAELGIQFIWTSHDEEFQVGRVVRV